MPHCFIHSLTLITPLTTTVTLPLLSVQVTELVDGIFIGGSINHVVADGTSFWRFMDSWSQTYNNKSNANVNASSFIRTPIKGRDPIINLPYTHHHQFIKRIKFTSSTVDMERFFHLSLSSISKLKAKANAEAECQKISGLSALVWRCITRARRLPQDAETVCKLATSNRHRLNPPLPDEYFGNPVKLVRGTTTVADLMSKGLGWAALQLNEAIRKHDDTRVKQWIHSWSKSPSIVKLSGIFEQSNTVTIGISPRFDMHACEFGLGKAIATRRVAQTRPMGKSHCFLVGMGPGAWVWKSVFCHNI
nr:uncharacterized acetyltransferase At3g50280-like [Tanacetum cinerariifolium]